MATGHSASTDLGHMPVVDFDGLEPGVILWDRFVVVGSRKDPQGEIVVLVNDLEKQLGNHDREFQLELHRFHGHDRARIEQLSLVSNRLQAPIHAFFSLGEDIGLLVEPTFADSRDEGRTDRPAARRERESLAIEFASLLSTLHEANITGVRFDPSRVRVDGGHLILDGFTHIARERHDPQSDIEALRALLHTMVPNLDLPPTAASARELWRQLRRAFSEHDFELPSDPVFVGRDHVLSELERGFLDAQIAKPGSIIIRGRRGVGKSRVLREFIARRIQSDDALVLTGTWHEQSAEVRAGLLGALEQLTRVLSNLDADERDDIRRRINRSARHLGAIVARTAPSLGSVLLSVEEVPQLELAGDFTRHTSVIASLFRAIGTRKRPLVLVLDNVESADSSSAAVLRILAQSQPAHHTVVILGFRTDGVTTGVELEPTVELELKPLKLDEIQDLLTRTLQGEVAPAVGETLAEISAGFPLVLWTTIRNWLDHGRLSRDFETEVWAARAPRETDPAGPTHVRELFAQRLAATSGPTQWLALQLAVLNVRLSDKDIKELSKESDVDSELALAELVDRAFLSPIDGGFRFTHDSIREFVLSYFDEQQQRLAHTRAAQMYNRRNALVAQIAYHRDLAFDHDKATPAEFDRLSRLHVEAGRDRLAVYDLERARWHLERALEHSRDATQRSLAAEGLADIHLLRNDIDSAVALYTAVIATSDGLQSVRTAAKAASFLFLQSSFSDGLQLGTMALEMVNEPTPKTPLGRILTIVKTLIQSLLGPPKLDDELRSALCHLYSDMFNMSLIDDPLSVLVYLLRGRWHAMGLVTGSASLMVSVEAAFWGVILGNFERGDRLYHRAQEIAQTTHDVWAEGYIRNQWSQSLFAADRYEEAQDKMDDAIGAWREVGDVSVTVLCLMFKGLYGRDREKASTLLGWLDEGISTVHRNGKKIVLAPLKCLKLHVLARQGVPDLKDRLRETAEYVQSDEVSAIERVIARIHLAFAAFECKELDIALYQVRSAINDLREFPGVPEFCQEVYFAGVVILMEQSSLSKSDRRLLQLSKRKFRRAVRRSKRLQVYSGYLELRIAIKENNLAQARVHAQTLIAEFERHQNVYVAREAYRTLANLARGEDPLASIEYDRLAREFGQRLGLEDMLLDDLQKQDIVLALERPEDFRAKRSTGAGFLTSDKGPAPPHAAAGGGGSRSKQAQRDVLEAWALTSPAPQHTMLSNIIDPVVTAVAMSVDESRFELTCAQPELEVPIASGDLQILLINLILVCRDAVDSEAPIQAVLKEEQVEAGLSLTPSVKPGRYLAIRVSSRGGGQTQSTLSGFATSESIVQGHNGHLSASAENGRVSLVALLPLLNDGAHATSVSTRTAVVVHPEASVRDLICRALAEFDVATRSYSPDEFGFSRVESAEIVFASPDAYTQLEVLGPLLGARLVPIVTGNVDPLRHSTNELRVPFDHAELEALLEK